MLTPKPLEKAPSAEEPEHNASNRQKLLMDKARRAATFDSRKLTNIIYGSESIAKLRASIIARVERDIGETDSMKLPRIYGDIDRTGLYNDGLAWGKVLFEDEIKYHHKQFSHVSHRYTLINSSPFGLHVGMFIPTLKIQASPEQRAYWLPLAESGKILGTYCQTELGHGSFVRGLETTAIFDHITDEFVIHSPTITSTKYWPGGLGYSASHAIVMACLIVKGNDLGVHAFMVQLRSLEDFKPLPGIELGDLGLKMGLNSVDNGYAIFNQVRIPRGNMMMRFAQLSRDGVYTGASHAKLTYSTMVYSRNLIVNAIPFQLAQAATIAIRYSVVQEQGFMDHSGVPSETPIISYKSQHYRLLSQMSRAFGIRFAGLACQSIYQNVLACQARGDQSTLAYGHITAAGLKAYATQVATDGAEDCRKCCGGYGYLSLSGFPELVANLIPTTTLEGENYVMYQQCARYLVKSATSIRAGVLVDSPMAYLAEGYVQIRTGKSALPCQEFSDPEVQIAAFRHRAARLIFECEELLQEATSGGLSYDQAWNKHMMVLIGAARAHTELFVLQAFIDQVASVDDITIQTVLKHLSDLFALVSIESPYSIGALGFFEDGYISMHQLKIIRGLVDFTLTKLLPEAVALTDSWEFSDASLQSALGRKDGNVYETLLTWTRQIPLNKQAAETDGVHRPGFEKYIRPIIQPKL